jgi:hypothetical protein
LLHCFAGCEPLAICRAIGVEFRDLFPARQIRRIEHRDQPRLSAADALEAIDHELTVATLILHDALEQRAIDSETWERLAIARARIGSARALTVRT